jgi:hypothetical protein
MNRATSRLRRADWLVAAGALALLIFMFLLDWYGGSVTGLLPGSHITGATLSSTGWETFTASRWIWLATIVAAFGSLVVAISSEESAREGPLQPSAVVAGLGAVSTALILFRIVHHPGPSASGGGVRASYGIKLGIWLGLLATLTIALGGYLGVQEQEEDAPHPDDEKAEAGSQRTFSGLAAPAGTADVSADADAEPSGFRGLVAKGDSTPTSKPTPTDGSGDQ